MPKTRKSGEPIKSEPPSTVRRSSREARETFDKAHDSAAETYGEGERGHRVAYSALKHKFEKKGDLWVEKGHKGPSDPRAADPKSREDHGKSYGGVDLFGQPQEELRKRAAELDVRGRSTMTKEQLAEAIARKQR
jgi:cation transport regulator ChaB